MGLRNQVDRQLGLGTHGVEAGRIQNHQPLFEQGVGHIDQGVAPQGHFDQALIVQRGIVLRQFVVPKAQSACFIGRDFAHLRDLFQRCCDLVSTVNVQGQRLPGARLEAPFGQTQGLQPGIDGQQTQAGPQSGVIAQLGGAHGGTPGAGRHDAAAITGKENSVDQLGFAARKLGNKSHHDFVGADLVFKALETLLHSSVHQLVGVQPLGQTLQLLGKRTPPSAVQFKLIVE